MTRSFRLLVNPASGGGRAPAAAVRVARVLRDAGARVELTYSPGATGCAAVVREAASRGDVLVAVGGDGMLASVATAVVEEGGVLGIVPAGRGNDYARMLGLPREPDEVARLLLSAPPCHVDVMEAGGRVVLGSVYAGVDSLASEIVDRVHRLPRPVQYPYAAVRALLAFAPARFTVEVDGTRLDEPACSVVVANSGYYGAGMHVAPSASLTDGLLDVVVVGGASRLRLVRSLPRIYAGSHVGLDSVHVVRGRRVRVAADRPLTAYGDGERLAGLPLDVVVRPGTLQVLRPLPDRP